MIRRSRPFVDGAEIDNQHLIGRVIDQLVERDHELDPAALAEIAPEDRVLEVIAPEAAIVL